MKKLGWLSVIGLGTAAAVLWRKKANDPYADLGVTPKGRPQLELVSSATPAIGSAGPGPAGPGRRSTNADEDHSRLANYIARHRH